ncbi:MAG: GDSL-type esterase/lipase family protein [Myxococcaceae bacterium]|nr:GDSL-type esterase/lipase family protein [Myxococcaceae bacterium]
MRTVQLRNHSTGLTIIAVTALAVGMSLLPLPDAWRPFPGLRRTPMPALRALLLPRSSAESKPTWDPDAAAKPGTAVVATDDLGVEPLPPAAHVGDSPTPKQLELVTLGQGEEAREARRLEALGHKMSAPGANVDQGCRRKAPDGECGETALAPFFDALTMLRRGEGTRPVRVVHLGDSLIASDHITDVIRRRLQARYGSGGSGFLFVDRPTRDAGRDVRTGKASSGWTIEKVTDARWPQRTLGFSGVAFSTRGQSERTEFEASGARVAELFFRTQPKGGALELRSDGRRIGQVFTHFPEPQAASARLPLPAGVGRLSVATRGGPVQLYGVALETGGPGVIYDSIGLPGATAGVLLRTDEAVFRAQLQRRSPALVVMMLGGNEAFELSRGRTTPEEARAGFVALVGRVREAVPDAACLLTGPMDAAVRTMGGELQPREGSREIARVVREAALKGGCAFWDMLEAMGGPGAAQRWLGVGMLNEDLIHPRAAGADLLGHLFDVALERAYVEHQGAAAALDVPGLQDAEALTPFFAALRTLSEKKEGRVAVAQLGASHTASHYFTDVMRARLAERFGGAGRGYVGAGRPSERLKPSGVERSLSGEWAVQDALAPPGGQPWGLTGTRAEGGPGSELSLRFCADCPEQDVRSKLELHYLEAPGMGRMEVLLDGAPVAQLPLAGLGEPFAPAAKVVTFGAPRAAHTLTVRNLGPGPLSVFGASEELLRPGIVYDALGLPGSTIFTLAAQDPAALRAQLEARSPGLFVLFYGTNESAHPALDVDLMRAMYASVFRTLREAAPGAACLLIGPTDRMAAQADGTWTQAPSQDRVIAGVRQVAREQGCAFWSARAAMGGMGSIARWLDGSPVLAHPDRVHLTPEGYAQLADALVADLLAAYEEAR